MSKLEIIRGDDSELDVEFLDSSGVAIDITGATVFFTIKKEGDVLSDDDSDTLAKIKKEVTDHTEPASGQTKIILDTTDTDILPGEYVYDLQLKEAGGNIISSLKDYLTIISDVTRRTS